MKIKKHAQQSRWVATSLVIATATATFILLWFYILAPPTKSDFKAAETQLGKLVEQMTLADTAANTYMSATVSSLRFDPTGDSIETDADKEWSEIDSSVGAYKTQLERLKRSPVNRDKEVNPVMERVIADATAFRDFLSTLTDEYPTYYKSEIGCDKLDRFVESQDPAKTESEYKQPAESCLKSLDNLSKVKLTPLREYAIKRAKIIRSSQQLYTKLAQSNADTGSLKAQLADLKEQTSKLDPITDVRLARDKLMNSASFSELTDLLKKKQA